jgi:hypothetical protein
MTALTFWQLPADIKTNIFEYDDTYQKKMKNEIFVEMWRIAWIKSRTYQDIDSFNMYGLIYDQLFDKLGIWSDDPLSAANYCSTRYFPSNIVIELNFGDHFYREGMGIGVKVKDKSTDYTLFEGWILDQSEHSEACQLENRILDALKADTVQWNSEDGLYLWEKMVW